VFPEEEERVVKKGETLGSDTKKKKLQRGGVDETRVRELVAEV